MSEEKIYVAETAVIRDKVTIGRDSSVWFGAVIRGDSNTITIGERSNVQDNAVIHTDPTDTVHIGDGVTIGHGAVVHGCTVGDNSLIGMGAIILNGAVIGKDCIVGAGALVPGGAVFGDGLIIIGSPARAVRAMREEEIEANRHNAEHYVNLAKAELAEVPARK